MGYTLEQKINICLKADANPDMTQADLAIWAKEEYGSAKAPSQTTISRILSSKNDLIATKDADFNLVRRRKHSNPLLRNILTEWITQSIWQKIPIKTPIIQLTANAIWNRLPSEEKDGNGIFNQKWCNHFIKKLNINITGTEEEIAQNPFGYPLNKVWKQDDRIDLKAYLNRLIEQEHYTPQDIFIVDEFQLHYSLPLDQIFDVSSIDKGVNQTEAFTENAVTIMMSCNIDGSEKLSPLIVGKYDKFGVSHSSHSGIRNLATGSITKQNLMNKITEVYELFYKSNKNKWITSSMFQNYLLTLEHKLASVSPNRKILMILDDSSSHRIINLKFKNIRLCYLKHNTNQSNPFIPFQTGVRFDYLLISFGIIEEFKILYRLQQYLEMINLQRINSKDSLKVTGKGTETKVEVNKEVNDGLSLEVLSESDYHIPLIKVIEWIKRSWESISQERIFLSWKRAHLFNFKSPWPYCPEVNTNKLLSIIPKAEEYDYNKSYKKLREIMGYLSVVIPWEIDDLLGIVNERGKIRLNYVSIEEIIGSCCLEEFDECDIDEDSKEARKSTVSNEYLIDTKAKSTELNSPLENKYSLGTEPLYANNGINNSLSLTPLLGEVSNTNLSPFDKTSIQHPSIDPLPVYKDTNPVSSVSSYTSKSIDNILDEEIANPRKHKIDETNIWVGNKRKENINLVNPMVNQYDYKYSSDEITRKGNYNTQPFPVEYGQLPGGARDAILPNSNPQTQIMNKKVNRIDVLMMLRNIIEVADDGRHLNLSPKTIIDLKRNMAVLEESLIKKSL